MLHTGTSPISTYQPTYDWGHQAAHTMPYGQDIDCALAQTASMSAGHWNSHTGRLSKSYPLASNSSPAAFGQGMDIACHGINQRVLSQLPQQALEYLADRLVNTPARQQHSQYAGFSNSSPRTTMPAALGEQGYAYDLGFLQQQQQQQSKLAWTFGATPLNLHNHALMPKVESKIEKRRRQNRESQQRFRNKRRSEKLLVIASKLGEEEAQAAADSEPHRAKKANKTKRYDSDSRPDEGA